MKKSVRITIIFTILVSLLGYEPAQSVRAANEWVVTNTNDSGAGSLRQAILGAASGDTIAFDPSLAGQSIHLRSELQVDKSITIDGSNLDPRITISGDSDNDGDGDILILYIVTSDVVNIKSIEFTKGYTSLGPSAGAIENHGDLNIYDSEFYLNSGMSGGAIRNSNNLYVEDCSFINNTAYNGGAIFNNPNAETEIVNSTFSNNDVITGSGSGGAIASIGTISIYDSQFTNNSAKKGGAIFNSYEGIITIENSSFIGNSTQVLNPSTEGGAIYSQGQSLNISNSIFANNYSSINGGAIYTKDDTLTITDSIFEENSALQNGGSVFIKDANATINKSTFSLNSAFTGGSIFIDDYVDISITNSTFANNSAINGGGFFNFFGNIQFINSTLYGNTASTYGGGVYNMNEIVFINSTVSGNSAATGAGIFDYYHSPANPSGKVVLYNSIVANSLSGENCYFSQNPIIANNYNLDTDGTCGEAIQVTSSEINLIPLADNGGPTQTVALLPGSPAIDAGDEASCPETDQRGVARPQDGDNDSIAICDIGAYEYEYEPDIIPPSILSITRADSNPTTAANVSFTVTFSEPVNGVDAGDFDLFTSGVTGASITGVSGSEDTYTVTVDTGSGNGSIRLDLIDDDSIEDLSGNKLGGIGTGNGDFISGEFYTVFKLPPKPVGIPRLSLPRRNAITNVPAPTFNWGSVLNAQGYEIVIATDSAFTQVVLSETVSSPTFTPAVPLGDGRHFWRVRALNSAAQPGRFSLAQAFTIDTTAPAVPVLTSPMDTASLRLTPVFRWTRVPGAVLYEFQYDNDDNFSSPTYSALLRTNYRKPPAMPNGTHYWRVRARDAAGNWSDWSPAFTVTISR